MLAVTLASMAGGAGGAVVLRHAWADRARERPVLVAAGWVMLFATVLLGAWSIGPVKGMAVGVAAIGIGALGVVLQAACDVRRGHRATAWRRSRWRGRRARGLGG